MKRLFLILLCLFWASFVFADIDTIEGTATADTDTYEGNTNTDTFEGNTIASSAAGHDIEDNFGSDSDADYSPGYGGITVTGGVAIGEESWQKNWVWHETSLVSADQEVEADFYLDNINDAVGILVRHDEPTGSGYRISIAAGSIYLYSYATDTDVTGTYIDDYDGSYVISTTYTVKVNINSTAIKVYVDGTLRIDTTDSTYSSGNYCGLYWDRGNGTTGEADNFWADAL